MNDETRPQPWTAALGRTLLALLLTLALLWPSIARAQAATVVPVGRAVGIKLYSDGVVVVGTSEILTDSGKADPAHACGLREGDVITQINSTEVDTIEEVTAALQEAGGQPVSILALREDRQIQLTATPVFSPEDGCYKLGAWIRDSMAGIGTVTFYDPASGAFGALGHGINDVDTALLMPMESGSILPASVTGVRRGERGTPGQLKGAFDQSAVLGVLTANTALGVFGTLDGTPFAGEPMETAQREEVRAGDAVILSNIAGSSVEEYAVQILKVYPEGKYADGRDFLIRVTDPQLLDATGGIVQGMSGSPIIQDGKLIGAVTHVMVDDPTTGYGIWIGTMLEAAG